MTGGGGRERARRGRGLPAHVRGAGARAGGRAGGEPPAGAGSGYPAGGGDTTPTWGRRRGAAGRAVSVWAGPGGRERVGRAGRAGERGRAGPEPGWLPARGGALSLGPGWGRGQSLGWRTGGQARDVGRGRWGGAKCHGGGAKGRSRGGTGRPGGGARVLRGGGRLRGGVWAVGGKAGGRAKMERGGIKGGGR